MLTEKGHAMYPYASTVIEDCNFIFDHNQPSYVPPSIIRDTISTVKYRMIDKYTVP